MSYLFQQQNFISNHELAHYLSTNFSSCLDAIKDGSLFDSISDFDYELYQSLIELTKEYSEEANILTMTIYTLDHSAGICTSNYQFKDQYEIATVMKNKYPNIVEDINILFKDNVLAKIFWDMYTETQDLQYKRYYTFMLHIFENRMYDFSYYYFLFLHLSSNDSVKFTLQGVKMTSVEEISRYIVSNMNRVTAILDEVMSSPFILALIAKEEGIDLVAYALKQGNSFAILKPLSLDGKYNFIGIIKNSMAFWLIFNYQNYSYDSKEAKALLKEYKAYKEGSLTNISDYINEYKNANVLYQKFKKLFVFDKLVKYQQSGISAKDDYYLSCIYDNEYVPVKFLIDSKLYRPNEHTEEYQDSVEREHLIDVLQGEVMEYRAASQQVSYESVNYSFNNKKYGFKIFESIVFVLLNMFATSYGIYSIKDFASITSPEILTCGIGVFAVVFSIITLSVYISKSKRYKRMKNSVAYFNNRCDDIELEIEDIREKRTDSSCFNTLLNLDKYREERKNKVDFALDLIVNNKDIPEALSVLNSFVSSLAVFYFIPLFVLSFINNDPVYVMVLDVNIYFYIYSIVNLILGIIFYKKDKTRLLFILILLLIIFVSCYLI